MSLQGQSSRHINWREITNNCREHIYNQGIRIDAEGQIDEPFIETPNENDSDFAPLEMVSTINWEENKSELTQNEEELIELLGLSSQEISEIFADLNFRNLPVKWNLSAAFTNVQNLGLFLKLIDEEENSLPSLLIAVIVFKKEFSKKALRFIRESAHLATFEVTNPDQARLFRVLADFLTNIQGEI